MSCYWLAEKYHQNPQLYLNMPLSEVNRLVAGAQELAEYMQRTRGDG